MKRTSAYRITCLRPRRSARTDEKGEIINAKREVDEVMIDLSNEVRVRFESEVSMETSAADTTPVSSGNCQYICIATIAPGPYIQKVSHLYPLQMSKEA